MTLSQHLEAAFLLLWFTASDGGLVTFLLFALFYYLFIYFFFVVYLHMLNTFFTICWLRRVVELMFFEIFFFSSILFDFNEFRSLLESWMEQLETATQIWRQHKLFQCLVFVYHCVWHLMCALECVCVWVCFVVFVLCMAYLCCFLYASLTGATTIISFLGSKNVSKKSPI